MKYSEMATKSGVIDHSTVMMPTFILANIAVQMVTYVRFCAKKYRRQNSARPRTFAFYILPYFTRLRSTLHDPLYLDLFLMD